MVGVTIKIAVEMEKKKVTIKRAFTSYTIGIGSAWLSSGFINTEVGEKWQAIVIATIAIAGEKIAEYLMYKLDYDTYLNNIFSALKDFIINFLTKSKK